MKIMVLDGANKNDEAINIARQAIEEYFKSTNHEVIFFTLRDLQISPCCGFFCCWLKTPGICVINDIGREIMKCAALSDCWVILTPIMFGGYSSELKKAIDRLAPLMLPYFMKVNGEVHHLPRYEKRSHLIAFGSSERHEIEDEEIFQTLVQRNSINFNSQSGIDKVILRGDSSDSIKLSVYEAFRKTIK